MGKHYLKIDCYTAARARVRTILEQFPRFYVSFSGGKDSGALLNLVVDVARELGRLPVTALILDLEGQYQHTIDYLSRECDRPEVNALWVCLPLHLRNAVSQFQPHWLCWDPRCPEKWIRPLPQRRDVIADEDYFPFFRRGMEFEEFVPAFGDWFADGVDTACFVGIRSDESLNRYRTITSGVKQPWQGHPWTTRVTRDTGHVYNAYPIYDWRTEDVWIANARQGWDYNRVYDLMHLAGLGIHQMRLCQPYGDDQRKGLWLFKILEPETWSRVVERVQGANFGNRYVHLTGSVMGNIRIDLPDGHTWRSYAYLILNSMPPPVAAHYRKKIAVFLRWWRKRGKDLGFPRIPDEAEPNLEAKRKAPSWRRICKTLLKNDYWCKGLSFTQTKREMERQLDLVTRYMEDL
ncbi:DUF3440 domain-containing protein [uncultured Thiodictyon sp.]|uniref:phosphoadenosine phosphosulfate reductase n=1 Tax=uncultured Thiodictyon sp. TaxID=1846217 RepID=UPI0025EED916|nr:DUF3440 domain-containing protein [uncultured Thiodictyon sp.]